MEKPKTTQEVKKGLSPEEMTLIGNIGSAIDELKQLNATAMAPADTTEVVANAEEEKKPTEETPATETPAATAATEEEEKKPEEEQEVKMTIVKKEIVTTPSDGATANDPPEKRIDDNQTEITDESLSETAVAKTVMNLLAKVANPNAAAKSEVHPVLSAIQGLTVEVKKMAGRQNESDTVLNNLLDATGITEQMKIAKAEEEKKTQPITANNNQQIIDLIAGVTKALNPNAAGQPITNTASNIIGENKSTLKSPDLANKSVLTGLVTGFGIGQKGTVQQDQTQPQ